MSGTWDNLIERETLSAALRLAHKNCLAAGGKLRGVLSGAAAYLDEMRHLGWGAPSFDSVRTRSGLVLYFGDGATPEGAYSADPRFIRTLAKEDYEVQAMCSSVVARDLADLHGARGYPSNDRMAVAAAQSLGLQLDEDIVPSKDVEEEAARGSLMAERAI